MSSGQAEYDVRGGKLAKGASAPAAFIYWKRPEEWAAVIYDWVNIAEEEQSVFELSWFVGR